LAQRTLPIDQDQEHPIGVFPSKEEDSIVDESLDEDDNDEVLNNVAFVSGRHQTPGTRCKAELSD